MTSIKINTEDTTILNFGNSKISQRHAVRKLRAAEFLEFRLGDKGSRTYLNYNIKVGIYTIFVDLFPTQSCAKKLKEYKTVSIRISEGNKEINTSRNKKFSTESWVKFNKRLQLKTSHLAEAIVLCSRLNNLKAFL